MIGRPAPGIVTDPGPTVVIDPGPVAIAIRSPVGGYARMPGAAVLGVHPIAAVIQILGAVDVSIHVFIAARTLEAAGAGLLPAVPVIKCPRRPPLEFGVRGRSPPHHRLVR